MNFEEALVSELNSIASITNKIYPLQAPEGTKPPYVTYVSSEGLEIKVFEGYTNSKEVECELNILHNTYAEMKILAKGVLTKIKTFQSRNIGCGVIENLTYDAPVELYENQVNLYRCTLNFKITFREE